MGQVQADQLGPAQGARKAKEEQRAIPNTPETCPADVTQFLDLRCGQSSRAQGGGSVLAPDAAGARLLRDCSTSDGDTDLTEVGSALEIAVGFTRLGERKDTVDNRVDTVDLAV